MNLEDVTIEKEVGAFKSFDGTPIYYESRGSGEPMVFVYGLACLMNHWHHQVHFFSKDHQAVTFDLRGHHKSRPITNAANLTMDAMAKDLLGLLDHLNLKRVHL